MPLLSLIIALMVELNSLEVMVIMRGPCISASIRFGAPSVTLDGVVPMQVLSANSWDIRAAVNAAH